MRVMITGEEGFIAKNLPASFDALGHEFVPFLNNKNLVCLDTGEPCVYRNTEDDWARELSANEIDLVVHNAAVVGTDVVALNSSESTQSNVTGTYNICRAAKKLNIPVCYIGTTVIYDTAAYQRNVIHETSVRFPRTLYGIQKRASEDIVMSVCKDYNIVRPLFAYGGVGDMNSLISKTFYAATKGVEQIDMFLDPAKVKDYMHVEDFCDGVALACHNQAWGTSFNIAAENPYDTREIVRVMESVSKLDLMHKIKWHPETDYLGNHRLSSDKFKSAFNWKPKYTLKSGIQAAWNSISASEDTSYDPLKYLNEAKEKGVDLTQFY